MNDQAESLRRLVDKKKMEHVRNTHVVAVVSGKGGVGKSNFSLNFAIGMAQAGKRVALIDLDIGMANIDILMGASPKYTIIDMIDHGLTVWDIIESGPADISYIAGGSSLSTLFTLNSEKFSRFLTQLDALNDAFDYIILDMGAGVSEDSLRFILSSHEIILVTTPEPTSITDAYGMLKFINVRDEKLSCSLLVNRAESEREGKSTAENLKRVAQKFLSKELRALGSLPNDPTVLQAVKAQTPFLLFDMSSKSSRAMTKVVEVYIGSHGMMKEQSVTSFVNKVKLFFRKG